MLYCDSVIITLHISLLIRLLNHTPVIITLHINLIKLLSHTPVIISLSTLAPFIMTKNNSITG
jgi:hypothetical protein